MRVVVDTAVDTHYGQLTLETGPLGTSHGELHDMFRGQTNGLCGAVVPGLLFMFTGLHTGHVRVRVILTDAAPPLGDWEEIVEVPFHPLSPTASLLGWGALAATFAVPSVPCRARWSARAMDAGHAMDTPSPGETAPDEYELTIWPAPRTPDAIIRRTSEIASYWHDNGFTR